MSHAAQVEAFQNLERLREDRPLPPGTRGIDIVTAVIDLTVGSQRTR